MVREGERYVRIVHPDGREAAVRVKDFERLGKTLYEGFEADVYDEEGNPPYEKAKKAAPAKAAPKAAAKAEPAREEPAPKAASDG